MTNGDEAPPFQDGMKEQTAVLREIKAELELLRHALFFSHENEQGDVFFYPILPEILNQTAKFMRIKVLQLAVEGGNSEAKKELGTIFAELFGKEEAEKKK